MRQRTIVPLIGLLVVCLVALNAVPGTSPQIAQSQASPRFTVTDLGTLGGPTSQALGINNAGQVVGISQTTSGQTHAFLWDGTTMNDINCPTCSQSVARAINAVGQVTGWALGVSSQFPNTIRAYLYSAGTGMVDLGGLTPDDNSQTAGLGINDLGWVVGHRDPTCALCVNRPFLYDGTGMRLIGTAQGDAFAVNNAGQVTGDYYFNGVNPHAFAWAPSLTNPTDLGAVTGDPFSEGFSIGGDGTIVGVSNQSPGAQHAIMWQPQGSGYNLINLGTTGTFGPHTSSAGVSNFGEIVGCVPPTNFGVIAVCDKVTGPAFLAAVPSSGVPIMVDLATLTAGTGCTVTGVGAINGVGQYAATGNCGGGLHALRLTQVAVNLPNFVRGLFCPSDTLRITQGLVGLVGTTYAITRSDKPLVALAATGYQIAKISGVKYLDKKCGEDPFDPNFPSVFTPQFHDLPNVPTDPCDQSGIANALNQVLAHEGRAISYFQAIYNTLNREQSAFTFGQDQYVTAQEGALGMYLDNLVTELRTSQAGAANIASLVAGTACDVSITQGDVVAFLNDLLTRGVDALPSDERSLFQLFGIDPASVPPYAGIVDPTQAPLRFSDLLTQIAAVDGQLADLYAPR